jgi:hypothetical protein
MAKIDHMVDGIERLYAANAQPTSHEIMMAMIGSTPSGAKDLLMPWLFNAVGEWNDRHPTAQISGDLVADDDSVVLLLQCGALKVGRADIKFKEVVRMSKAERSGALAEAFDAAVSPLKDH